jgi:non-heme chloroperoxidase
VFKRLRITLIAVAWATAVLDVVLVGLIAVPPGEPPAPVESLRAPFAAVQFSDLPAAQTYPARDGQALAFRFYPSTAPKVAVLVHGASANSTSLHALARSLARQGVASVYALDIRGHGASGPHGDIGYLGQLDDDLVEFAAWLRPRHPGVPVVLAGFSSGGGFVTRLMGDTRTNLFDAYLLLAPYLRFEAPTTRPGNEAPWAKADIPRIIGLTILSKLSVRIGQGLTVVQFGVAEADRARLTPAYSFRLNTNFSGTSAYLGDMKRAGKPMAVLVGERDELLYAERFDAVIHDALPGATVQVIPGVGHTSLLTDPGALQAIGAALRRLPAP